ncbi:MAG TPA: chromate transporter [Hydrogenophaga sp.]|uniref:chromate transporter n=1 Tax=Hydrogenophaga sp. TaxID=1904254 RepID=UPI002BAEC302|nr:chromate transporter [Hydrogenophaga sp.]HMN91836.1 chromate transporter [Hydrogenophaga sp.]HMP09024.1 chromate transporter [Hydrogenophaga sp.]
MQSSDPDFPLAHPRNKKDLFWSFTWLALQGFGGVIAVVQRELVERKRWLSREQFIEDWAVAQVLPGPNVVNLSMMIGGRHFGLPGALAALAGMLLFPLLVVLIMATLFVQVADSAVATGALRGMGAVAAGLITATGFRLIAALERNPLGMSACLLFAAGTFLAIALMRWPLVWVLLGLGPVACLRAGQLIAEAERPAPSGDSR